MKYLVEVSLPSDEVTPLDDMSLTLTLEKETDMEVTEDISMYYNI